MQNAEQGKIVAMSEQKEIVVVSPHLDDAVIMCGATIDKLTSNGLKVNVLNLTGGTDEKERQTDKQILSQIGVHDVFNFTLNSPTEIRNILEKAKLLIIPHRTDMISEHRNERTKFLGFLNSCHISSWIIETGCPLTTKLDVDISITLSKENLQRKAECLKLYDWYPDAPPSKIFDIVHNRDWIWYYATYFGQKVGEDIVEVFDLSDVMTLELEDFL